MRFEESVRGCDAFVVQSHTAPINTWLMEQLIMVDALKRASAKRITVVAPFFPYARQDKKHRGREPISARLVADMFKTAGADRLMTVDLHTAQIQGFFDGPVDHLFALDLLVDHVCSRWGDRDITVVSPDAGRVRVAERWTDKLGGVPLAFIHKTRDPMRPNEVKANRVVGEVEGRVCILVDDMIDTGGTIVKAAETLFDAGAADVIVTATHGVLSGPAVDRLKNSQVSEVIVTNTLPIEPERHFDKLTVLSIAPLLARAIKEVFEDGSVTSLFDGNYRDIVVLRTTPRPGAVPGCAEPLRHACAGPFGPHSADPLAGLGSVSLGTSPSGPPLRRPSGRSGPLPAPAARSSNLARCPARERSDRLRDRRACSGGRRPWRCAALVRRPADPIHLLRSTPTVADFRLEAETRTEFGKGSARRDRRAGRVPAVLYGHGQDVVHLSLPAREFAAALRNGGTNALLTIVLDGKEQLALTKAVQRDPLTRRAQARRPAARPARREDDRRRPDRHRRRGGSGHDPEPPAEHGADRGRRHEAARQHRGRRHRPRPPGQNITAGDLVLPRGATLITDAEALVIGFLGAPTAEQLEAELEEAEAEAGIEREESDEAKAEATDAAEDAVPSETGTGPDDKS